MVDCYAFDLATIPEVCLTAGALLPCMQTVHQRAPSPFLCMHSQLTKLQDQLLSQESAQICLHCHSSIMPLLPPISELCILTVCHIRYAQLPRVAKLAADQLLLVIWRTAGDL